MLTSVKISSSTSWQEGKCTFNIDQSSNFWSDSQQIASLSGLNCSVSSEFHAKFHAIHQKSLTSRLQCDMATSDSCLVVRIVTIKAHLLRMHGILMQLAAATAANGTYRPTSGGIVCKAKNDVLRDWQYKYIYISNHAGHQNISNIQWTVRSCYTRLVERAGHKNQGEARLFQMLELFVLLYNLETWDSQRNDCIYLRCWRWE